MREAERLAAGSGYLDIALHALRRAIALESSAAERDKLTTATAQIAEIERRTRIRLAEFRHAHAGQEG